MGWKEGGGGEEGYRRRKCKKRTQSSAVSVEARSRTADGSEASGAERASAQWAMRAAVTVERQSTTVPKTSKRRASGGSVVDIVSLCGGRCEVWFMRSQLFVEDLM